MKTEAKSAEGVVTLYVEWIIQKGASEKKYRKCDRINQVRQNTALHPELTCHIEKYITYPGGIKILLFFFYPTNICFFRQNIVLCHF